jgi:antitoxin component of MazEF toxin-antitoxin module
MTYQVNLEEDPETGELILPLPEGLLEEMGWEEGDDLKWVVQENGSIVLSKVNEEDSWDNSAVETLS